MKPAIFVLSVPIFLGGCSAYEQSTAKMAQVVVPIINSPKKTKVQPYAGTYYRGDGLGYNIFLDLKSNGTYSSKWRGCEGLYGTAQGQWASNGKQILLKPSKETDMMKGHLRTLDVVLQQKK
jgi:hypothetical protein